MSPSSISLKSVTVSKIAVQLPGVFKAGVVVAPDQVLMAPEPGQGVPGHQAPVIAHVPHHIHGVLLRNGLVPPVDELAVHVLHGVEGPGGQKGLIVKMQVGGIEDHGVLPQLVKKAFFDKLRAVFQNLKSPEKPVIANERHP